MLRRLLNQPTVWRAAAVAGTALVGSGAACEGSEKRGIFDDPVLKDAIAGRKSADFEMRLSMADLAKQQKGLAAALRDASVAQDHQARAIALVHLMDFHAAVRSKAEAIMYPGQPPGLRQKYLDAFGCAAWTEAALTAVQTWAPARFGVVELGAGSGRWAAALRLRGVDVAAFDNGSELPDRGGAAQAAALAAGVDLGDESVLTHVKIYRRALLLVYPPPGPMASACLSAYQGDTLLYVGEGRGGVNGDDQFFGTLEAGEKGGKWILRQVVELAPFPGGHEKLYVFKLRHLWAMGMKATSDVAR